MGTKRIPFNLQDWLSDKSQKVVTRDGRPVEILKTNMPGELPLLVLYDGNDVERVSTDGKYQIDYDGMNDLFLVTEDELSDTEDERIRKELVAFFKEVRGDYWHDILVADILAYLEKQKEEEGYEAIPIESTLEFKAGKHAGFLEGLEVGRKQKEQKPNTPLEESIKIIASSPSWLDDDLEHSAYNYAKQFSTNENQFIEIRDAYKAGAYYMELKQKPEWSEEDVRNLYNIIFAVNNTYKNNMEQKVQLISWLKSIRPCPHWKSNLAIADLENQLCELQDNYHDGSYEYRVIGEAIEYIRSTEPHWKPSEEQMYCLEEIIAFKNPEPEVIKGCESLSNELKKLED